MQVGVAGNMIRDAEDVWGREAARPDPDRPGRHHRDRRRRGKWRRMRLSSY